MRTIVSQRGLLSTKQGRFLVLVAVMTAWACLTPPSSAQEAGGQSEPGVPSVTKKLTVGTKEAPPFSMREQKFPLCFGRPVAMKVTDSGVNPSPSLAKHEEIGLEDEQEAHQEQSQSPYEVGETFVSGGEAKVLQGQHGHHKDDEVIQHKNKDV